MISHRIRRVAPAPQRQLDAEARPIVERMADIMREMRAAGDPITADSLAVRGDFTSAEVAAYAREASDLARSREVRQVA